MSVEIRTTKRQDGTVDVVIYINGKFFDCKTLTKKEVDFYEIETDDERSDEGRRTFCNSTGKV